MQTAVVTCSPGRRAGRQATPPLIALLVGLAGCASTSHDLAPSETAGSPLTADTPMKTTDGSSFTASREWTVSVRGPATILTAPEGDSHLALIDVQASDADAAVAAAWASYQPEAKRPLRVAVPQPNSNGFTDTHGYAYQTSPNEKRDVGATASLAHGVWTVLISDLSQAVEEKRLAQISLTTFSLTARDYVPETFAGKTAHPLDPPRIAELTRFVTTVQQEAGIPGVSVGIIQDGKVVMADGFGERELGTGKKPDADTLYLMSSNIALTTLLEARLVDQKRFGWDTPVTQLMPSFKLGDPALTSRLEVKDLSCSCTGLPRQDLEWNLKSVGVTPADVMAKLADMHPTAPFGQAWQYSNYLAAVSGYVAAHVLYPERELGAGYEEAMRTQVLEPLGMSHTSFDMAKALASPNHAAPTALDVDGNLAPVASGSRDPNLCIYPLRPQGGAWSSVNDLLKWMQVEASDGLMLNGERFISPESMAIRRSPRVTNGKEIGQAQGTMLWRMNGIQTVDDDGTMFGWVPSQVWLPEQHVGFVLLTNGATGWVLRDNFTRKLLEVLFDGRPEAEANARASSQGMFAEKVADRKALTVPADPALVAQLAHHYVNGPLGELTVLQSNGRAVFDFGGFQSEVASRKNPDGSTSFITISPGVDWFELVVGSGAKRALIIREAQHEYTYTEG